MPGMAMAPVVSAPSVTETDGSPGTHRRELAGRAVEELPGSVGVAGVASALSPLIATLPVRHSVRLPGLPSPNLLHLHALFGGSRNMKKADLAVAQIAEDQFGAFSRAQAADAGLSEYAMTRRVASGAWLPVLPGVYRLPGTPRTGRQRAMAATLWAGPDAVASYTTAARLLRLDGVRVDAVHLTILRASGRRAPEGVVLHRSNIIREDRVTVDGIPCTSATRTVIDCAAPLDDEQLEVAYEAARRMGLTSPRALERRAAELCGRGHPGSARVKRLLAHQQHGAAALQYRLEVKTARLIRASSLPRPVRQHPIGRYRVDFAWPDARVAVECDGFEHHGYRLAWKRDRRRLAEIEAQHWRVVIVTWDDVTSRPDQTVDRIAIACSARGLSFMLP